MQRSNIVSKSNIYPFKNDDPWYDSDYVSHVFDLALLKDITFRNSTVQLSTKQEEIKGMDTRCIYAQNDPCWGYSEKEGKTICACINDKCPKILECNPNFKKEDKLYWDKIKEDILLYGNPKELSYYYIADLISEEEKAKYDYEKSNWGKHPIQGDSKPKQKNLREYKIDPETNRIMVAIGYEWKTTDNASYEEISLVPIWGYLDEIEEDKEPVVIKKAKRIEKLSKEKPIKNSINGLFEEIDTDKIEKTVKDRISNSVKLTELDEETLNNKQVYIILDNPAELAFVSSTLLTGGIEHGIKSHSNTRLILLDDLNSYHGIKNALISSTVLKKGCTKERANFWGFVLRINKLLQLDISERDYYLYKYDDFNRWTCRNMYGVTHICVLEDDLQGVDKKLEGIYRVSITNEGERFVISDENGKKIGSLNRMFNELIKSLKENDEIPGTPSVIKGLSFKITKGQIDILGMGNLKFLEY